MFCIECIQYNADVKPRSHRARRVALTRVYATTFGLLASNVCIFIQLSTVNYVILSYVIVYDVISTGVVWWSLIATRTLWLFIVY